MSSFLDITFSIEEIIVFVFMAMFVLALFKMVLYRLIEERKNVLTIDDLMEIKDLYLLRDLIEQHGEVVIKKRLQ